MLNPYDKEKLRTEFQTAQPFPFVCIENFLTPEFVADVAASYPSFGSAKAQGHLFDAVNEKNKIQITDHAKFPDPVKKLNELISSERFLKDLEYITGIDSLLADDALRGGGMHLTGARGRLDVHVDFNFEENQKIYRRLNILIYLNEGWRDEWGGAVELWDQKVKTCHHSLKPILNRCVIFETSNISYHGVEQVTCPPDVVRRSFAAYYYTKEPPAEFAGEHHSTIFKARPDEKLRGYLWMPLEKFRYDVLPLAKDAIKKLIGRG